MKFLEKIFQKFQCILPVIAALMLCLMLIPAEFWNQPTHDAIYEGFDANLIYVDESGNFPSQGLVTVTTESIQITALPNSQPIIHLITTTLDNFQLTMDVHVLKSSPQTSPLRIGVWGPRSASGYFIDFGPSPENLVSTQLVTEGTVAQTLIKGKTIKNETLFNYDLGQHYHLNFNVDRKRREIIFSIIENVTTPTGNPMLKLPISDEIDSKDVLSDFISVEGGEKYSFGGFVKLLAGSTAYKIDLEWIDKNEQHLSYVGNWRSVKELNGWTEIEFQATAPKDAAFVRMLLSVDEGTYILFSDLFLEKIDSSENLLINGNFAEGTKGWNKIDEPLNLLSIIEPHTLQLNSTITNADLQDLFDDLRISFTVSAYSETGISIAALENYTLTLDQQRWFTLKVDDNRLRAIVIILAISGSLLIAGKIYVIRKKLKQKTKQKLGEIKQFIFQIQGSTILLMGLVIAVIVLANLFLFGLGNLPFDMSTEKIWAYVAVKQNPSELYYRPNFVSLAKVWGGTPYHEAVFPYNFCFAYLFTIIGWIYRVFLNGPGSLVMDTFALEFLIKSFNLLFIFFDGLLIYLILKGKKVERKQRIIASALFLFNPAVWFIGSIWGQTHLISLFFLLLALWLTEKKYVLPAWIVLVVGALNRPQMLIPLFLLVIVLLRNFPAKENLKSIFWSIIIVFLLLVPFSLTISPSTPVDILRNQLFVQEAGGNEPSLTLVSLDTYNLWPLITYFQGARGLERIQYPSTSLIIGQLTYQQISQILTFVVIFVAIILIMLRRNSLLLLALGTVGFLIVKTGLASTHFVLALPLLILCRKYLGNVEWYTVLAIWTATMLIPMYGVLGFAIENVQYLAPALHSSNNIITRSFMSIYSSDWCITAGSLANLLVLIILAFKIITLKSRDARRSFSLPLYKSCNHNQPNSLGDHEK